MSGRKRKSRSTGSYPTTKKDGRSKKTLRNRHHSMDRRISVEWAEEVEIRWTYRLPNPRELMRIKQRDSDRFLVAMLRHDFTNYDELKIRAGLETPIPALTISRLWERVTDMCCTSVGLPFGDGMAWKEGLIGSFAAKWGGLKIHVPKHISEAHGSI